MSNRLFGIESALAEAKGKPLQNMTISTGLVVDMAERITALEDALRDAVCPIYCYNGGIYTDLGHDDLEREECEWCANRTELLGETV